MCVLRASGETFDAEAFVHDSSLEACKVFRRGEPRFPKSRPDGPKNKTSGMNVAVSGAPCTKERV